MKCFFPVENFHFGWPKTNFSGFWKWRTNKKNKQTKNKQTNEQTNKTKQKQNKKGKSILQVPDTGTSQYWWILEHYLKMWYLRSSEHTGVIQKLTILEHKNGLVLSNTCVPVPGTWSFLPPPPKKKEKQSLLILSLFLLTFTIFHLPFFNFPFFPHFPFFPCLSFPGRSAEISRSEVSGGALFPRLLRHWY